MPNEVIRGLEAVENVDRVTSSWLEFARGIPTRLLLPVDEYLNVVNFPVFEPDPEELLEIRQRLRNAAVKVVRESSDPELHNIILRPYTGDDDGDDDAPYFHLYYSHQSFDFALRLFKDRVEIGKHSVTFEELYLTIPLLTQLAQEIFLPGPNSLAGLSFFQPYDVEHRINQHLVIGNRVTDETASVTNVELMNRHFLNSSGDSIVALLQPDAVFSGHVETGMRKIVDGRPAAIGIEVDAPVSTSQRDLNISVAIQRGGTLNLMTPITPRDLVEFDGTLHHFYKDMIVQRVLKSLFADLQVQPSVRG